MTVWYNRPKSQIVQLRARQAAIAVAMDTDYPHNIPALLTADQLERRVAEIGAQIAADYRGRNPILVGILYSAMVFMADLMRRIDLPLEAYAVTSSSYNGTESTGIVRITKPLDIDIAGHDVIVVEDIIDTGLTLSRVLEELRAEGPSSLEVCALLSKRSRRVVDVPARYVGFEIPDEFVVGYGLDYNQQYRNLPFVGMLPQNPE